MKKFLIVLLILGVSVLNVARADARTEDGVNLYEEPRDLPTRPIYDQYGKKVKLSDFNDNFVIAIFWSRYCSPCIRELDNLNNYQNIVKNDGIKVVLISPDTEWNNIEEQKKLLRKYRAEDLDFYLDADGKTASDLGIFTSPNTVLINREGKEIGRIRGSAEWDSDRVVEYLYKIKAEHG